jgi:hypothetical protein
VTAAQLPVEIEQGSDCLFSAKVVGGPTSLSGYTGEMQIRGMKTDEVVLYQADPGDITFDVPNRIVTVRIPYEETSDFTWDRGVYDVRIKADDDSEAWRVLEGKVTVDHWVTREDA